LRGRQIRIAGPQFVVPWQRGLVFASAWLTNGVCSVSAVFLRFGCKKRHSFSGVRCVTALGGGFSRAEGRRKSGNGMICFADRKIALSQIRQRLSWSVVQNRQSSACTCQGVGRPNAEFQQKSARMYGDELSSVCVQISQSRRPMQQGRRHWPPRVPAVWRTPLPVGRKRFARFCFVQRWRLLEMCLTGLAEPSTLVFWVGA
jgi:hypothetical protein